MAEAKEWILFSLLAVCLTSASYLVNDAQPFPYMDEVFHIPQAQRYCAHNFSFWDPMITTLPGLYLSSVMWLEPLSWLLGNTVEELCSVSLLRAQNVFFTLLCFLVLHGLTKLIHRQSSLLFSLSLATYPLLFFFSLLYYTDNGSTLCVLLGYWLALKRRHLLAALMLGLAILFRQTNIVWVVFVAGSIGLRKVEPILHQKMKRETSSRASFLSDLSLYVRVCLDQLHPLISHLWPFALLVSVFLMFVAINGGIVVGDRSHHQASLHLPQFLYFISFSCALAGGPLVLSNWRLVRRTLRGVFGTAQGLAVLMFITGICLYCVHFYTYEHPYLLADNRHFPFYVWKNLFRRHKWVKYLLVPCYALGTMLLGGALAQTQSLLWVLLFSICCGVALVPQVLLEFRYYTVPFLLLRLHLAVPTFTGAVAELVLHSSLNVVTLWLFLYRPFRWPSEEEWQRFMW